MKLTRKNTVEGERDWRTLRAGTLDDLWDLCTDLPRESQPPQVRSKMKPPSGQAENSNNKRVTPWLFRRVNALASPTSQRPEEASADVEGSAEPPSYSEAQKSYPSKEKSTGAQDVEITAIAAKDSHTGTPLTQSPTQAPTGLAWPNRHNRTAGPSVAAPNLRQPGLLGTVEEATSRPWFAVRRGTPPPAPASTPAQPPSYRPRALSTTPTLPPYSATEAPSRDRRPQDRSRKPSSGHRGGEPRLALPSYPLLPDSAVSRIRAAYRVSNELGSAVMLQEVRVATPVDYARVDAVSTPRVTRRFVSVTESEGFRKVHARVERRSGEREAPQRKLSKPSEYGGRDHDGKIHGTTSERVNPMRVRDDKH